MGLDIGLERVGIKIHLACEFDKVCQETIKLNRPDIPLIGDVMNYNANDIRRESGLNGEIDLIVGGPPCQAFSTAGARKGFQDKRGNVFLCYVDLLLDLRPKYIVIENVRGLLSVPLSKVSNEEKKENGKEFLWKSGGALLYIIEKLRSSGYSVSFNLYNTANYGVPQTRERVVLICSRDGRRVPYIFPTNSEDESFNLPPWRTLRDAITDLKKCEYMNFPEKRLQYYKLLRAGENWKNLPFDLQPIAMGKSFYLGGGKTGFYRRLSWDKPSCTLVTSPTMPATDMCHPEENRPLSIQEYKRIQMFPDDWKIAGKITDKYKQIGNAVPVGFGECIGKTIIAHMYGNDIEPPKNFKFSRYKNTDDVSWEKITRRELGLSLNDSIVDLYKQYKSDPKKFSRFLVSRYNQLEIF